MAVQTALMASNTRSNRRAARTANTDDREPRDAPPPKTRDAQQRADHEGNTTTLPPVGRTKRLLSTSGRESDLADVPAPKRQKTDVDGGPPKHRNKPRSQPANATRGTTTTQPPPQSTARAPPQPDTQKRSQVSRHDLPPTVEAKPDAKPRTSSTASHASRGTGSAAPPIPKHRAAAKKSIQHELDRLQPSSADSKEKPGGRKLRSQEATRFKSELSAYFLDYDEVIGNDPKEQHLLNFDTPIIVDDSSPRIFQGKVVAPLFTEPPPAADDARDDYPIRGYGDALFSDLFEAQRIDFDFLGNSYKGKTLEDPLADELYLPVHRKAERLERSIRNTEKGRAQHEKDQIVRILDGLQGHDWLRIMGVSGVTESRKKSFEPARRHFIKGCQALIDKFRQWGLAEKRRKAEKERALAERAEQDGSDEDDDVAVESGSDEGEVPDSDDEDDDSAPVDENDVEASIAKQLRQEAAARSRIAARAGRKRARTPPPPKPAPPPREFKSFFKKKHERDTALNRNRRSGRRVLAWGEPVPDMPQQEFMLPEEFLDAETMKAHARNRRRQRRGSRH